MFHGASVLGGMWGVHVFLPVVFSLWRCLCEFVKKNELSTAKEALAVCVSL
jgi:hypothetical protein